MKTEIPGLTRVAVFGFLIIAVCALCGAESGTKPTPEPAPPCERKIGYTIIKGRPDTMSQAEQEKLTEAILTLASPQETTPAAPEVEPAPEPPAPKPQELRYSLTDEERTIVEAVVAAEAGGEDYDGQCLVAQCILNTAEAKGIRPDEVVLANGQYTTPNYKRRHLVEDAVAAVFDDGYTVTTEPIMYFYAPKYGTSKWHESLNFVLEHGGHRFFKK